MRRTAATNHGKMKVFPITVNIYAEDEEEAEQARHALGAFVDQLGQMGIMVTGRKVAQAVPRWDKNLLVKNQVISHFRER